FKQGSLPRSRSTQRIWPASRCGPQSHRGRAGEELDPAGHSAMSADYRAGSRNRIIWNGKRKLRTVNQNPDPISAFARHSTSSRVKPEYDGQLAWGAAIRRWGCLRSIPGTHRKNRVPRLRTLHRAEDIGSVLEGGVKVCKRPLVNEVLGLQVVTAVRAGSLRHIAAFGNAVLEI